MTNDHQPMPDADIQDELDLKSIVEATFGPGAFDLLTDEQAAELAAGVETAPADLSIDVATEMQGETAVAEMPGPGPTSPSSPELSRKLVLFELDEQVFAIPVSNVSEIQREPQITRIPHVPEWVCGVTNLRGSIISVIDLRLRLGLPLPEVGIRRRMIVIRSPVQRVTTGLLVDRVLGIRVLSDDLTAMPDLDRLMESLALLNDAAAHFASEWTEMDMQPVAVLDLEKAIDLNHPS